MADDFEGMSVFLAVAEALNFRVAGERLGVTRSAVSQALQRLEDRIGVALVQRTTRSVRLTEAGELLYDLVKAPARDLSDAVQAVRDMQRRPTGLLRLAVSSIAERFISGALLAGFLAAHPDMKLDVTITDDEFDIVEAGFDAGVRLGEVIERDMIAVAGAPEQRQFAVSSCRCWRTTGRPLPASTSTTPSGTANRSSCAPWWSMFAPSGWISPPLS